MKKIFARLLFVKILLFVNFRLFAPVSASLPVEKSQPIDPFVRLIYAIGMVETGLDTLAYNPLEEAVGYFQIRPIRLEDYNIRTGSKYTMKDLFNYKVAEKIFRYYASKIGPNDPETIARRWNGSGAMTLDYWNKVKVYM